MLHELDLKLLEQLETGDAIARSHADSAKMRFRAELERMVVELEKRMKMAPQSHGAEPRAQYAPREQQVEDGRQQRLF